MGRQKKSFRIGWENEHLAAAILSKFCFISAPVKIGDDIGTDFFCTLFEQQGEDLIPKNSFMIQIKTSKRNLGKNIEKTWELISNTQIPYVLGFINRQDKSLIIYSGESLCHLAALSPADKKRRIILREDEFKSHLKETKKTVGANFHKVLEIKIDQDYKNIVGLDEFKKILERDQKNISRIRNSSTIFELPNGKEVIYFGPESAKHHLANFIEAAKETLVNLEKIPIDKRSISEQEYTKLEELKEYLKKNWVKIN